MTDEFEEQLRRSGVLRPSTPELTDEMARRHYVQIFYRDWLMSTLREDPSLVSERLKGLIAGFQSRHDGSDFTVYDLHEYTHLKALIATDSKTMSAEEIGLAIRAGQLAW